MLAMDDANLPDPRRTLNEVGFDSLTGVEFCNRVGRSVGQHLNPAVLFDYPTLESFAGYVVRDVLHMESESEAQPRRRPSRKKLPTKPGSRCWPTWKACRKRRWMPW